MNAILAHFDGKQIRLDEPLNIEPGTKLIITILPKQLEINELDDWTPLAMVGLENAYGENEPEYSLDLIKQANPDYERR